MAKDPSPPHSPPFQNLNLDAFNIHLKRAKSLLPWILLVSFISLLVLIYSPNPRRFWLASSDVKSGENVCNLFDGRWVRDYGRNAYGRKNCRTIPESKDCARYGKDQGFVHWRWKPRRCDLPRFDAKKFLRIVRGKRMAFVGDSVSRNQMESLLCLLTQVETPIDIQEKDSEDRFRTWYFRSYDFILMTLWTKFLIAGTERTVNGTGTGAFNLHLDKLDTSWTQKLPWINYVVISAGHWYFRKNYLYENNKLIGCIYCSEDKLKDFEPTYAIRKACETTLQYIYNCKNCDGLVTVLRTFSPAHFENGNWNGGGYCNRTKPSKESDVSFHGTEWKLRNAQVEEVKMVSKGKRRKGKGFRVLDVTKAMMMRPDAHPDIHWNNQWMKGYSDCVHWCMPGPIDTWNELMLQVLKEEALLV
ncbi:uncharacterized protein A4U43_C05F23670 [Asparagus officinalis]|uniref:Uncharacterized protein n=1 Tax=Asparagus officinalis TaxID=4686 RepID=A0A5P1ETY7_ASPOF|nr:protein ALTERED XYLOGLUCAN 4-like [Asparagus officinalis]ONK69508.1 uncharacterized protein A4U43_C05F23670 [Asparagus officinalis]